MPRDIAVPPADARFEERDRVLRVSGRDGRIVADFRVDDGIVYAKSPGADTAQWCDVSAQSIIALFAADSPVAGFLRGQGANPLRLLLTTLGAPSPDDDTGAS